MNDESVTTPPSFSISGEHIEYVSRFMAAGDVRYYLNGICVQPCAAGGVLITATDGHTLCSVRDPEGTASGEIIFRAPKALIAATKVRKHRYLPSRVTIDLQGLSLTVNNRGEPLYAYPGDPIIDGKFPEWIRILPAKQAPGLLGNFNMNYIRRLVVEGWRGTAGGSFFHDANNPGKGVLIFRPTAVPEGLVMIMPMHDDPKALPDWADAMLAAREA